jgi:hypothetical protein
MGAMFALSCMIACGEDPKPVGELVISLETDMALPQQVDTARIQVLVHGQPFLDQDYPVGTWDGNLVPATLTLVAGKDPALPVTVRVSGGKRGGAWRTFREVVTTVPPNRAALLRMPMQWLCDGTAQSVSQPSSGGNVDVLRSTCPDGNTCAAGRCVPSEVPIENLPIYQPEAVFGGASDPNKGTCFDTLPCLITGALAEPDADCTVAKPPNAERLNVGLRVTADGICDSSGTTCFVPLDGNSAEGWTVTQGGERLALPEAACERLHSGLVNAIYVSTACSTKTAAFPPCGPWSSVTGQPTTPTPEDAGSTPRATRVVSLVGDDADERVCCPLMGDAQKLYTCLCQSTSARLVEIDPLHPGPTPITSFAAPPEEDPRNPRGYFAAAMFGGTFFLADAAHNSIERRSLLGDGGVLQPWQIAGDFTQSTPLLVDSDAMYLLASGVNGSQGEAVQLIRIDHKTAEMKSFDTGGNYQRHQFAQDIANIYVATNLDNPAESVPTMRSTHVSRLSKADGTRRDIDSKTLPTSNKLLGGYIGVHTDGTRQGAVYALEQRSLTANGMVEARISRFDAGGGEPTTLFARFIDSARTAVWILAVVDGAVLLVTTENGTNDAGLGSLRSSSVTLLPAGGGAPRIVADFSRDTPILGFQGAANDAEWVYWLNRSGDLYRLSRADLP